MPSNTLAAAIKKLEGQDNDLRRRLNQTVKFAAEPLEGQLLQRFKADIIAVVLKHHPSAGEIESTREATS